MCTPLSVSRPLQTLFSVWKQVEETFPPIIIQCTHTGAGRRERGLLRIHVVVVVHTTHTHVRNLETICTRAHATIVRGRPRRETLLSLGFVCFLGGDFLSLRASSREWIRISWTSNPSSSSSSYNPLLDLKLSANGTELASLSDLLLSKRPLITILVRADQEEMLPSVSSEPKVSHSQSVRVRRRRRGGPMKLLKRWIPWQLAPLACGRFGSHRGIIPNLRPRSGGFNARPLLSPFSNCENTLITIISNWNQSRG